MIELTICFLVQYPQAVQARCDKCALILLESGANPNIQDNNVNTALHFAIYVDNRRMAAKLLEHHANIEIKNKVCVTQV